MNLQSGHKVIVSAASSNDLKLVSSDASGSFNSIAYYFLMGGSSSTTYESSLSDAVLSWEFTESEKKNVGIVVEDYSEKSPVTYSDTVTFTAGVVYTSIINLLTVKEAAKIQDGYTLTGTLGANVKISIADGATVTLTNATINSTDNNSYKWAGITCGGDAAIVLSGDNEVKGFYNEYPGIYIAKDKTLTINGTGSLTASSNGWGAGIGSGNGYGGTAASRGTVTIGGKVGAITESPYTYQPSKLQKVREHMNLKRNIIFTAFLIVMIPAGMVLGNPNITVRGYEVLNFRAGTTEQRVNFYNQFVLYEDNVNTGRRKIMGLRTYRAGRKCKYNFS